MKAVHIIAWILLVIGGLNWLLTAFGWNVVDMILGQGSVLAKIVYILVGISALISLFTHKRDCKACEARPAQTM